jgi:AcrR family transcriptional regulator
VRERIVEAAVQLLRSSGAKRLSQPQVARAAGVPQGHLTYYFPRRRDLLIAVARRGVEELSREVGELLRSGGWPGADASTRARALTMVGILLKDRSRTRFLLALLLEAEQDPKLRDLLVEQAQHTRSMLARGLQRSEADPEVDLALALLWGLGIQHLLFTGNRPEDITDELIARLARLGGKP